MALSEDLRSEIFSCTKNFVKQIRTQEEEIAAAKNEMCLKIIAPLVKEHEQAFQRLHAGLDEQLQKKNERNDFAVFPSVWRTERLKLIHANVQLLAKPNPKGLEQGEFTVLAKTHLDDLALLLGKAIEEAAKTKGAEKMVETARRRVLDLMEWLGKKPEFLPTVKIQKLTSIPDHILKDLPSHRVLKRGTFKVAVIGTECEILMGLRHIAIRRANADAPNDDTEWEVAMTADLEARAGDTGQTLNLTGIGLRKVLVAKSDEMRDDWIAAINDVKTAP